MNNKDEIKACIFDLNGTVLSDEDEYEEAFGKVLKILGVKLSEKPYHTKGIGVRENWPDIIQRYNIKTNKTVEELALLTQEEYLKLLSSVKPTKGFEEFIKTLRNSGIKTALATSNNYSVVSKIFETFPIENYFDVITTAEEVKRNKPDPEIFLITADKLLVEPSECIVFEDSKAGIEAAREAGMKAVGIIGPLTSKDDFKLANLVVEDFTGNMILGN